MNFTDNNPLSMTGEDSFTSINEILQRCVLIDTNQTILSNKIFDASTTTTFDGDVELNGTTDNTGVLNNTGTLIVGGTLNLNTDIVADKPSLNFTNTGSTIINPSNIMALQVAGTDKFVTDAMNTQIYATSQLSLSAGASTTTMTTATFQNNFGTQQLFSVNSQQKLQLQNTNTNLNNTTTSIQSGGTTKIQVGASTTTLNNTTTEIQSGGTNRVTIDGTTTGLNNTTTNIQSGGTNKITIDGTTTGLNNTTTNIQSGGTNRVTIDGTTTGLNNTTTNIQSGGTNKITINATGTTLNNDTTKIQSGGFDKIDITSTTTTFQDNTINMLVANPLTKINFSSGSYGLDILGEDKISVTDILSVFENTTTQIRSGGSSKITTNATTTTLNNTATSINSGAVVKYLQNATDTTLSNDYHYFFANTENRFRVGGVDKEVITSSATTLTNTAINLTALGTTGAIVLTGGGSALNNGITLDSVGDVLIMSDNDARISGTTSVVLDINATAKHSITSTTTTMTNGTSLTMNHPTTTIQSAGSPKITIGNTDTSITNSGAVAISSSGGAVTIACGSLSTTKLTIGASDAVTITGSGTSFADPVGTTEYYVGSAGALTFPLVSFMYQMVTDDFNTNAYQLIQVGYPNADFSNRIYSLRMPYRSKVVGWSISGDADAHSAVQITCKLNSGPGSTPGTTYFSQTNSVSAGAITSNSATASINGFINNFATPPGAGTFTSAEIPAGSRLYGWVETSANFLTEFSITYFFQQVV